MEVIWLPLAGLDARVWQALYVAVFSLGVVASLGFAAPSLASRGILRFLSRPPPTEPTISPLPPSRSEELLKELEDSRLRGEYRHGIVSVYQALRNDLITVAGVKVRRGATEQDTLEHILKAHRQGLRSTDLRKLYALYETARFGVDPVGEPAMEQVKGLLTEISSQLEEPRDLTAGDIGQP